MYTKDKIHRITLRVTDEQFEFITANSDMLGVSPSDFLRMLINATLSTSKQVGKKFNERFGTGRENDETNQHYLV